MKITSGSHHRRGLAVLAALAALVFVAIAITALSAAVSDDARQSINQSVDAQLQQMLLAGAYDAKLQLTSGIETGRSWSIEIPTTLSDQGAHLRSTAIQVDSDQATLRISARLDRAVISQTLNFQNKAGNWTLLSAQLD